MSANSSFALYDDVFHSPTKHFSNFVLGCDLRRPAGLQRRFTVAGGACGGVAEREQERVEDVEGENRAREVRHYVVLDHSNVLFQFSTESYVNHF